MGKASENEGIKLRAAWFNNISVGLALGGVFIPGFSLFRADNFQLVEDWFAGRFQPTLLQASQFLTTLGVLSLAFVYAGVFREEAKKEIAKIQD